jgi:hypothetical protein
MLKRLKKALVTSFVGAIALGWVFAQGILHSANILSAPIAGWLVRREYRGFVERANSPAGFSLQDALPELARSLSLLLVGYLLLRWLYLTPLEPETMKASPEQNLDPANSGL